MNLTISQESLEEAFYKIDISPISDAKKLEITEFVLKTPAFAVEISVTDYDFLPTLFSNLCSSSPSVVQFGKIEDLKIKQAATIIKKTPLPQSEAQRILRLVIANPIYALLVVQTSTGRLDSVVALIKDISSAGLNSPVSSPLNSSPSFPSPNPPPLHMPPSSPASLSSSSSSSSSSLSSPKSVLHKLPSFSSLAAGQPPSPRTPASPSSSPLLRSTLRRSSLSSLTSPPSPQLQRTQTQPQTPTSPPSQNGTTPTSPIRGYSPLQTPTSPSSPFQTPASPSTPRDSKDGQPRFPKSPRPKYGPKEVDYVIKLLLLGDSSVGKSCLLLRYCENHFTSIFVGTIGIDFRIKSIDLDGKRTNIQIWDTAGQERFRTITRSYYRGAQGIILVYDTGDETTFTNTKMWMRTIEQNANENGEGIVKILVGNKCDMTSNRVVTTQMGQDLANTYGMPFFETSAKTGANVAAVFEHAAREIIAYRVEHETRRTLPESALGQSISTTTPTNGTAPTVPPSSNVVLNRDNVLFRPSNNSNCCGGGSVPNSPEKKMPRTASPTSVSSMRSLYGLPEIPVIYPHERNSGKNVHERYRLRRSSYGGEERKGSEGSPRGSPRLRARSGADGDLPGSASDVIVGAYSDFQGS